MCCHWIFIIWWSSRMTPFYMMYLGQTCWPSYLQTFLSLTGNQAKIRPTILWCFTYGSSSNNIIGWFHLPTTISMNLNGSLCEMVCGQKIKVSYNLHIFIQGFLRLFLVTIMTWHCLGDPYIFSPNYFHPYCRPHPWVTMTKELE
jgi:hypothetical protein